MPSPMLSVQNLLPMTLRLLTATLGGYALCWSLIAALCVWLPDDRVTLWYLTGQLVPVPLTAVLLWAFAARTVVQAVAWPLALAAGFALLGWLG